MSLILVTGRSGSGKSTFAKLLAKKLDYRYIDIDRVGHSIYDDKEIMEKVVSLFGQAIFDDDGKFNRKKLGKIIFEEKGSQRVKAFNDLTWKSMESKIDSQLNENIILDWILLPTTKHWENDAIKILVVPKNNEERLNKIIERDHISREYLKNRESAGIDYNENEFDFIVTNDYSAGGLEKWVEEIAETFKKEIEK